jgi:serine/threonine protein kinase
MILGDGKGNRPGMSYDPNGCLQKVSVVKVLSLHSPVSNITTQEIAEEVQNAKKIKSMKHANIVDIFSISEDVQWRYGRIVSFIQMEKCQLDLQAYIISLKRDETQIVLSQYVNIMIDIFGGLTFLHQHNLVHRDIKATNSTISIIPRSD